MPPALKPFIIAYVCRLADSRMQMLEIHLREVECSSDVSLKEVAGMLDGYSGADIANVCR